MRKSTELVKMGFAILLEEICVLENQTPGRDKMATLTCAGNGKNVVFTNKRATHDEITTFLEAKFQRLKYGGGFDVLKAVEEVFVR